MKNKGFTLIELLGVIIILALLMIIVFPSIINSVKNSSNKTDDLTKELIYNAADLFIDEHTNDFPKMNGSKYSIELSTLVNEGLLTKPIKLSGSDLDITNNKCIQVIYNDGYNYQLKDSGACKEIIKYSLPDEYQQVEYIESTGTQYINTNYVDIADTSIELDFVYTGRTNKESSSYMGANGGNVLSINVDGYFFINAKSSNVQAIEGTRYKINSYRSATNQRTGTINDVSVVGTNASISTNNYYIMALGNSPSSAKIYGKVYSCRIYYQSVLVRDLIPCYRKSDSVIGMYDLVNNVFYTNAGTGNFEKGANV